jgi:PAS domain S-box-containing protein
MLDFFDRLYESTDFMPHGECLVWDTALLWQHAGSDIGTGVAYYLIGAVLFFFIFKRRDIPFFWIFLLFGAFFLSCGTSHFMGAWTIYYPSYWTEGKIKTINAFISLGSAVILIPLMPRLLALPNLQNARDKVAQLNKELRQKVISLEEEAQKRQKAEETLIESERKLFTLMGNLPGMAYRCRNDENWTMEFVSNGCLGLTGYQSDELVDNRAIAFNTLIHSDDQQSVFDKVQESLDKKLPFQLSYRLFTAAGEEKWVWEQGVGIYAESGTLLALEGFITDITQQKRAEESLNHYRDHLENLVDERTQKLEEEIVERQQAEQKSRDLLDGAPDAMALVDTNGKIVLVNKRMEKLFNFTRKELLHKNINILIPERFREKHGFHVKNYFADFRTRPMGTGHEIFGFTKDGKEFPADISLSPLKTKDGVFVLADIRDITERRKSEERIKKSYYFENTINTVLKTSLKQLSLGELLERILDSMLAIPMLSLDKIGSIYLVEDKPEHLVLKAHRGYDDALVNKCAKIPFGKCLCGKAAETSNIVFSNCLTECHECYEGISPHGHYCIPIISGKKVLGVLNLVLREGHERDQQEEEFLSSIAATLAGIIERKEVELEKEKLQYQLIESEKLSALGRMMSNVAHEIRNPLTAIGGLTKRLHNKIHSGSKEKEYTKVIISETMRLERILRSVLTFTQKPSIIKEVIDLNEVIDESLRHFEFLLNNKAVVVSRAYAETAAILINEDDANEVIEHILSNAIYVTPKGGEIAIITAQENLEGVSYMTVKVTDTGAGITEDERSKIFEPFYTTKPGGPGHGIGLGLSISRKIMQENNGLIKVDSKVGEGATFTLYFPGPN